ncbi:iron (metal) dependent repressor, DtxR family [Halorhabdus utahensis DSM 12940]|uniref:Iron (Metal) dependent repressor, DtxR family n=1 Tax=Halorhabdus utahensis (strain DSM 12940 / JCM 11049 / AX-2) TaxID=519442 RepID=C7NTK4_HALUD|nr:metal-dependent transcriptional regulator [Halorhabdus utahensis]ACV12194.1 iron (metal) dependent repressor, DtxR family [Halorhabdus utahensis DSM 12940]
MQTDVMEDYLKVIYRLEREEGAPVGTSAIADALDVTAPTATRMLEKLADEELIEREKYSGVELTEHGRRIALETVRHHRLLEAYLVEHLDYEWGEVHDEAERLEHHISESFEERIADLLGHPPVDPHGEPIPGVDLEPPADADTRPLSSCESGERIVVATVRDRDEETLQYLADSGIVPGRKVTVTDVTPVDVYVLEHEEGTQHLSAAVAESVYVETPAEESDAVPEEVPGL